jgi:hypothetical protein
MYVWEHPRWEDYDYESRDEQEGNPFSWLGNGYVTSQLVGDVHGTTFYLDEENKVPLENPITLKTRTAKMAALALPQGSQGLVATA